MSTQEVADLIQSVNDLTGTVAGKMGEIDQKVDDAEQEFNEFMVSARLENAIYRQSKNQFGNVTDGMIDYFSKNSQFPITISVYRTIVSGIDWSSRDPEEQEIMTAMGLYGEKHFQPTIRVMKMVWSGFDSAIHNSYSIYPNPIGNGSGYITVASYAKLVSGGIYGMWLNSINNDWGLCGAHYSGKPGFYLHAHPRVTSASGEVLFIWPGIVSGHVPLDKNSPKWGYWPSMYGENPYDATPGS